MAKGDAVNGIGNTASVLDFQPAAGVECIIKTIYREGNTISWSVYNGTNTSSENPTGNSVVWPVDQLLTNTNYLRIAANGANRAAYSGITTK